MGSRGALYRMFTRRLGMGVLSRLAACGKAAGIDTQGCKRKVTPARSCYGRWAGSEAKRGDSRAGQKGRAGRRRQPEQGQEGQHINAAHDSGSSRAADATPGLGPTPQLPAVRGGSGRASLLVPSFPPFPGGACRAPSNKRLAGGRGYRFFRRSPEASRFPL